ncbi:MAG TPA: hypothetical protein VNF24_03265, partial [Candidatus Acidoferrales bacterium]|nr:hypothetical protein [Candidatus Acidoferrales bacterium]
AWVIDGNYRNVRDLVWARADTVVWLDLPRRVVMTTVIRRTLHGVRTRRELWNGNRENWRNALSLDPCHSIVVWTWVDRRRYQASHRDARGGSDLGPRAVCPGAKEGGLASELETAEVGGRLLAIEIGELVSLRQITERQRLARGLADRRVTPQDGKLLG